MSYIGDVSSLVFGQKKKPKGHTINLGVGRCMLKGTTGCAGKLKKAHIKAEHKGGRVTWQLCTRHHEDFDDGKLNDSQLRLLGLSRRKYNTYRPKRGRPRRSQRNPYELDIRMPSL